LLIHSITTTDLYEVSFLLCNYNFCVEHVQVIPQNKAEICQFTLTGDDRLPQAQLAYFNNEAEVKVLDFRRALHKVNTMIGMAKKNYKQAKRQEVSNEQ
jgi:hypothetical protein